MVREFKEGMFRLGLGLTLLFLFLGLYMRSYYIGAFYQTVDGYLIVLPVARLAFMIVAVAALIGLARPLSEAIVDAAPLLNPKLGWSAEEDGPRIYRDLLYSVFLIVFYIAGYLMIAPRLSEAVAPLEGYGWVTIVFGLAWLGVGIYILVRLGLRAKREYFLWRSWFGEQRMRCQAARSTAAAAAGEADRRFCKECGAPLKDGAAFCKECGRETA